MNLIGSLVATILATCITFFLLGSQQAIKHQSVVEAHCLEGLQIHGKLCVSCHDKSADMMELTQPYTLESYDKITVAAVGKAGRFMNCGDYLQLLDYDLIETQSKNKVIQDYPWDSSTEAKGLRNLLDMQYVSNLHLNTSVGADSEYVVVSFISDDKQPYSLTYDTKKLAVISAKQIQLQIICLLALIIFCYQSKNYKRTQAGQPTFNVESILLFVTFFYITMALSAKTGWFKLSNRITFYKTSVALLYSSIMLHCNIDLALSILFFVGAAVSASFQPFGVVIGGMGALLSIYIYFRDRSIDGHKYILMVSLLNLGIQVLDEFGSIQWAIAAQAAQVGLLLATPLCLLALEEDKYQGFNEVRDEGEPSGLSLKEYPRVEEEES